MMLKRSAGMCIACLILCLASPIAGAAPKADPVWLEPYCQLIFDHYSQWESTDKAAFGDSYDDMPDRYEFTFQLFDLNGDGIPELFLRGGHRTFYEAFEGAYTVIDGAPRKFGEGPQERISNARWYLWLEDRCDTSWWELTFYDFETCTMLREIAGTKKQLFDRIEAQAAAYGLAGGGKWHCTETLFRISDDVIPAMDTQYVLLRREDAVSEEIFRFALKWALESHFWHNLYEPYSPDDGRPPDAVKEDVVFPRRILMPGSIVLPVILCVAAAVYLLVKHAKRKRAKLYQEHL